jgi:hypothetical protein
LGKVPAEEWAVSFLDFDGNMGDSQTLYAIVIDRPLEWCQSVWCNLLKCALTRLLMLGLAVHRRLSDHYHRQFWGYGFDTNGVSVG